MREQIQALVNELYRIKYYSTASAISETLKNCHDAKSLNQLFEETKSLRKDLNLL